MNPFIDMVRFTPNEKRYYLRSIVPTLVFIALFALALHINGTYGEKLVYELRVAIGLVTVLPMAWVMKLYIDYFRACDEWEKLIEVYGICIGMLLVGMSYFSLGILAMMDLVVLNGLWLAYFLLPAHCLTYVLGKIIGRWRHG